MIHLAEWAETYIDHEQHQQRHNQTSIDTKSNLENRPSKRKRINQAKAKYN